MEGTGQGAQIRGWGQRDAYPEVFGCGNGGEGASRKSKRRRKRRKKRKRGKGEAASPPLGRGRRNRSPTNWRMHRLNCNDRNISDSSG